ncbi:hydrolase [Streptomyces sp. SID11385]|nr:hydrolase [Streptomyces sp. SID11385]
MRLRLRNTGDVVDEYRFEAVGALAPWTVVEPQSLRLYPGTTGTVRLEFAPPRIPDAAAGPHPYAVRITPTEHPEAVTVPEGVVTVTPFEEVRAELVPPVVKGRFRGRPRLAVDNLGNVKVTASVNGNDNGDQLSYDIRPGNVQIEPGRAAFIETTLRPRRITWFGSAEQRPFTLAVRRSGVTPLDVEGTYVQRAFAPRWLAACLGILTALALTFVMLWIAYKPHVSTAATEQLQQAGVSTLPPEPTLSPQAPKAPPAASAPPVAAAPQESETGDGGGSGQQESKPPQKAAERTAATAVRELAAEDPGGRHICYRVYVRDKGWTEPACDDAPAGTPGSGAQLTAVNVSASGTNGTTGGAFVPDPASTKGEGHYPDPWTNAADGVDHYFGSTDDDAPYLMGFSISVNRGKDAVCQSSYVHDDDWLGLACDDPTSGFAFTYVGTHDNKLWIEAVRLKV